MRSGAASPLLLLGTLALLFAAGEVAVRAFEPALDPAGGAERAVFRDVPFTGRTRLSENPRLVWELDTASPLVNEDGYRGEARAREPAAGTFRIVALGDSVTFGRGVPTRDAWPAVLERLLNASAQGARRYEVLNLGVGGYNTRQAAERYRVLGRRLAPDLAVVAYVLNDAMTPEDMLGALRGRQGDTAGHRGVRRVRDEPRSALFELVSFRTRQLLGDTTALAPQLPFETHEDPARWRQVTGGLRDLVQLAAADGVPGVVAVFPWLLDLEPYPYAEIHDRVAAAAGEVGLRALDLEEPMRGSDGLERFQLVPGDTTHPNAAGHRRAAEAIHARLRAGGAIAPTPSPGGERS